MGDGERTRTRRHPTVNGRHASLDALLVGRHWTNHRGVEAMDYSYALVDRTVSGRQERWEDSPAGWQQRRRRGTA